MVMIAINPDPQMTRYLVEKTDVFRDDPVTIVDVGARWGFNPEWKVFGKCLHVYCFEPDEEECRRLNASAEDNVKYIPCALGRVEGEATLYETNLGASSGLYKTDMSYLSRLTGRDNCVVVAEHTVRLKSLAGALQLYGVRAIDFIKLDVEGAELDVLAGGELYLQSEPLIGILSEIRFQEEINGSPVFSKLDEYVRQFGFRLYDLQFYHQSRCALPYPSLWDYRTPKGERFYAYTTQGQIMDGDALYFRDLLIPANGRLREGLTVARILKQAALFEIYSLNDCAAELIISFRNELEPTVRCDTLLDLLTPALENGNVDHKTYIKRYFHPSEGIIARTPTAGSSLIPSQLRNDLDRVYAAIRRRLLKGVRAMAGRLSGFFRSSGRG